MRLTCLALVACLGLLTLVTSACNPDVRVTKCFAGGGGDSWLRHAVELQIGEADGGTLDPDVKGRDWRYFRVPDHATLEVNLAFTAPDAGGTVIVRDATGMQVTRSEAAQASQTLRFRGDPGIFYLELFATHALTEYTLAVHHLGPWR